MRKEENLFLVCRLLHLVLVELNEPILTKCGWVETALCALLCTK